MKRSRLLYFILGCAVVALGLASRRYGSSLPQFFALYAGDSLWGLMVFVGMGFLFPRWTIPRVSIAALLFCYADEVSQLYHAPWIDGLRHTRLGALILGFAFLWSDLLCYTVGVGLGALLEAVLYRATERGERK